LWITAGAEQVTIDHSPAIEAVDGSYVNVTCHASPSRPPVTVTWSSLLQNEAIRTENEAVWTYNSVLSDNKRHNVTSVLMITANRSDNDRVYQCSAVNVAMTTPISATVQLTVNCKRINVIESFSFAV